MSVRPTHVMPRRIQPTLMDYVVIAINPALIIVLINSLVYFLLEMFYQGQYPERLHFCLSLFIFGAVLIARISMEEGREHGHRAIVAPTAENEMPDTRRGRKNSDRANQSPSGTA